MAAAPKATSRKIDSHDKKVALKAKSLYEANKKKLGLNQSLLAKQMDMTQSAINQYLNCSIPMNMTVISQLADIFGVKPTEIDPKYNQRFRLSASFSEETISPMPVIGTSSGNRPTKNTFLPERRLNASCYAVEIDEPVYKGIYDKSTIICADSLTPIKQKDPVLLRLKGSPNFLIMELISVGTKNAHLGGIMSTFHAKKHKNPWFGEHPALPKNKITVPLTEIISLHKIVHTAQI